MPCRHTSVNHGFIHRGVSGRSRHGAPAAPQSTQRPSPAALPDPGWPSKVPSLWGQRCPFPRCLRRLRAPCQGLEPQSDPAKTLGTLRGSRSPWRCPSPALRAARSADLSPGCWKVLPAPPQRGWERVSPLSYANLLRSALRCTHAQLGCMTAPSRGCACLLGAARLQLTPSNTPFFPPEIAVLFSQISPLCPGGERVQPRGMGHPGRQEKGAGESPLRMESTALLPDFLLLQRCRLLRVRARGFGCFVFVFFFPSVNSHEANLAEDVK